MNNWMIVYQIIEGRYMPVMFGNNVVPDVNADKVIQVPKEIARQANKFHFDGKSLKRKEGEYILSLEELEEADKQEERLMSGGLPPSEDRWAQQETSNGIEIQF